MSENIWRSGAVELRRRYARHELSPHEVVEALARRIEQVDPQVHAFTTLTLERALDESARQTDELARGEERGPLHGVPVGIKELFDVGGAVTSYGSLVFSDRRADLDAVAVRNLRRAGAIVLGLTRSHEFGWGITTQHAVLGGTRNPWDFSRVPGGSSGGSAAALATGMVPLALGSDTGGSIRIPACYCGVAGFKPTYGRVSAVGAVPLAPSLDHPGPMARDVADLALMLGALMDRPETVLLQDRSTGGTAPSGGAQPLAGWTVGIVPDLHLASLAADHLKVFEAAVAALEGSGAVVRQLAFPGADQIRPDFASIQMAEARHVHAVLLGTFPARAASYGADVRRRLEAAAAVTLRDYLSARDGARRASRQFAELLSQADVLLTPVTSAGPSRIDSPDHTITGGRSVPFRDVVMPHTVPQNLAGLPACGVPAGFDADGLPVGVQLTAGVGREARVLQAAAALEQALGPGRPWPGLPGEPTTRGEPS
jgi:aspartyl-tRNA(Asn)/glutamyl-tRNA(Gln) amidotransferase subunit A